MLRSFEACWLALLLSLPACAEASPAETSLELVSERRLLDARVHFETPPERGENVLVVELLPRSGSDSDEPRLLAVDAVMAAHTHEAHAEIIEKTADGFRASKLNLFMTGRWQLELALELADARDSVSLPVDVP